MPTPEHVLPYPSYLDHLRTESARFRVVLTDCEPTARVPACPDWDAADLVWHLAEVQLFWAKVMRHRPAAPADFDEPAPQRPAGYAELLDTFDDYSHALATELERADPGAEAWHWEPEKYVATNARRQAHEALIHRVDAEQAAGLEVGPFDPALAADGVLELLEVMYGGQPPAWATFTPSGHTVAVELADAAQSFLVSTGSIAGTDPDSGKSHDGPHLMLVAPDAAPDATVSGTAAALDLHLWRRGSAGVTETGDPAALESFRAAVSPPLD